jgi:cell division protein FtsL
MLRLTTVTAVLATLATACGLYWVKLDTRQLELKVQAQERMLERAEHDIAVLRAEIAHLTRPERLAPLARGRLGLQPMAPEQLLRDGDPRLPAKAGGGVGP